jgi:hypothetical protein
MKSVTGGECKEISSLQSSHSALTWQPMAEYETLCLRQEFVLFNDGRYGQFAVIAQIIDAHHVPLALHSNALRQCNLRRKCQGKSNWRALFDCRIKVKTNAASADISNLRELSRSSVLAMIDGDRNMECEPSSGPFLFLRLSHAILRLR